MTMAIDRDSLNAKLQAGEKLILVEALPEKYFRDWHLPGARHLPHDQVAALAPTTLPDREAAIVVYCASSTCRNSHIAARALERLGYANVMVYPGGKQDWHDAGLPIERSVGAAA